MLLRFVSQPTIGPKERRLIRSHVMKGKNAGKSRPARNRLIHRSIQYPNCTKQDNSHEHQLLTKHNLSLQRLFWNDFSLSSLPCDLCPATEKLVHHQLWLISKALYPPEFCTELNIAQYSWTQFVFEDAAYLHALLAISASFPTQFGGTRNVSASSLRHISTAYRMTNARLSGPDACSNKAIAVVTMLAIYQRLHHQQAVGLVHFAGLQRMIALRGGLEELSRDNRAVAQKPWRLGIEFALQDGGDVGFQVGEVEGFVVLDERVECGRRSGMNELGGVDPVLRAHFESTACFIEYLNNNTATIDPLDYSDAVCMRLHRLLAYASLSPEHRSPLASLDNIVHLTLVAIMTTLMPEYGHHQARYKLLGDQLLGAFRLYAARRVVNREVLLWSLFVGYTTILHGDKDEVWLVELAADMCVQLDLHDWSSIHRVLRRYAWINVIHDNVASKVLTRITEKQGKAASE